MKKKKVEEHPQPSTFNSLLVTRNSLLEHKLPILIEQLAVHKDFRVRPHVADHVPVDDAFVLRTGFRVAVAERHVKRTADLFVE